MADARPLNRAWALLLGVTAACTAPVAGGGPDGGDAIAAVDIVSDPAEDDDDEADGPPPSPPTVQCKVPIEPCDVFTQTGCPASQHCVIDSLEPLTTACVPVGARRAGGLCVTASMCERGLSCLPFGDVRACARPCCRGDDAVDRCASASDPAAHCVVPLAGLAAAACTVTRECDYLRAEPCLGGDTCRLLTPLGEGVCLPAGSAAPGQRCSRAADCAPNLVCRTLTPTDTNGRCWRQCNPREPACPDGTACVPFVDRPPDYGACVAF